MSTKDLQEQLSIYTVAHGLTQYLDASPEMQIGIEDAARIITSETADPDDQSMARSTLAEWLWPSEPVDLATGEADEQP